MARNGAGTYSLYTPGNPVVTGTIVSSTWGNNTLTDIATALTDSLSRTGLGGMSASLKLTDGVIGGPGLSWSTEPTSGLYRASAGNFRWSLAAADIFTITANGVLVTAPSSSTVPSLGLSGASLNFEHRDTAGAADAKRWNWITSATTYSLRTLNDAGSAGSQALLLTRSGYPLTNISFGNATDNPSFNFLGTGVLQYGGIEVGYRGFRQRRDSNGASNTAASDAGGIVRMITTSGVTFTLDSDIPAEGTMMVVNVTGGNITIAASSSLTWLNGSGALSSGSRTLAQGGIVSVYSFGSGDYYIWGTGVS